MQGLMWCVYFVVIGVPVAMLGIALDSVFLMVAGGGAVAAVVVGWPVLVLLGELGRIADRR